MKASTPTALRKLARDANRQPLRDREPAPSGPLGGPPAWLSVDALDEWQRVVPPMEACGAFTSADYAAVLAHCIVFGEVVKAAKAGEPMKVASLTALRLSAADLGLTPTSRTKLVASPALRHDQAEDFFAPAAPRRVA